VEAGLACLPAESPYARVIPTCWTGPRSTPMTGSKVWRCSRTSGTGATPVPRGPCPFNIDAKLNGAYIALGLLYGKGDFGGPSGINPGGQDSDCNPSNAAGVLGVAIPERWKAGIAAIADEKFDYTDYSFREIVESTLNRAIAMAERNGGSRSGERLLIKLQAPVPAELKLWDDYGEPVERIGVNDPRWTWQGSWAPGRRERNPLPVRASEQAGDSGTLAFEGTGAILVGPYLPDGGKAEIYLNGALDSTVDVYSDEVHQKGGESVWHRFGLTPGRHEVQVVVLGEPGPGSSGNRVVIQDLVVFR
jgi:hypothetical protein